MFLIPLIMLLINYIWISALLFFIFCILIDLPSPIDNIVSEYFGRITFIISVVFTYFNLIDITNVFIRLKEMII